MTKQIGKRIQSVIAVVLAMVIYLSVLPMGPIGITADAASSTNVVPEGFTAIRTVLDLYSVRYDLAGNYILMNDIDLTEATAVGGDFDYGGNGWNPIGSDDIYSKSGAFTGIFDGNGYTISGMRIDDSAALPSGTDTVLYFGLFANNAGTIKNLHISGSIVINKTNKMNCAGGVAACNSGIIEGCSNEVSITVGQNTDYRVYAGGIVASNSGSIKECYNTASIMALYNSSYYNHRYAGGISGYGGTNSLIENCYNIGDVTAKTYASSISYYAYSGGIQGYSEGSSDAKAYIKNSYNLGTISATASSASLYKKQAITYIGSYAEVQDCYYLDGKGDSCAGATKLTPELSLVQSSYDGFDFENVWEHNSNAIYEYPQLRNNVQDNRDLVDFEIYTLPQKTTFIKWEEFEVEGCTLKFTFSNAETEYVTVTKDMVSGYDLDKVGTQTLTIKSNRREISYDIIVLEKDFHPVYSALDLYNIRYDLTANYILMNDIDLTEATAVGGDFDYGGNGWNPIGSDDIYGKAGAFTGIFDGNGYTISGMRIDDSAALPSGTDTVLYFGLFAKNSGTIKNLHISGSIVINKTHKMIYAGGVAALNSGIIEGCSNEVSVTAGQNTGYRVYVGGIAAYSSGSIKECYNTASIMALYTSSYYNYRYAGGISGYGGINSLIENCYNIGDVTAKTYASSISYYAYSGGIQGYSEGSSDAKAYIKNSYNLGTISATASSASLYKKQAITYIGSYAEVQDCYYLTGSGDSCTGATQLSAALLKQPTVLKNFDFENVWTMAGDPDYEYAELQRFPINGAIGVIGDVSYLSSVEPDLNDVFAEGETYTCEWYVNGTLKANTNAYTLQASDIGKKLKIKVTGTDKYNKGILYSDEITVSKAVQTAAVEVPQILNLDDNKLEISTVATQEYSIDNANWQSNGVFKNLDPNKEYTVYSRILENDLYLLGESEVVLTATTDRCPLTGVLKIVGDAKYGNTLTADVSSVGPAGAVYSYEWKRGNEVVGHGTSYTIKQADIDQYITLSVNGINDYTGAVYSAAVKATKANVQTPSAPVVSSKTNTSVVLIAKSGYEYSMDKITWQDSPRFDGLSVATEYTFYQRIKETETTFASLSSGGTKVTTLKNTIAAPAKPIIKEVTNNSITLEKISGYEYSLDGITWQTSNVFSGLEPNKEYAFCQRIAETIIDYASAKSGFVSTVTLKNQVNAPSAPIIQEATSSVVTLAPNSKYEFSKDGINWQKSNIFSGLTVLNTYTFYQRVAETETDYASDASVALNFKVKNVVAKPAVPVLKNVTNNRIEVETAEGCVYSLDGENWTAVNVFDGLEPNTQYSVYCVIPETDTHYGSAVSEALVVVTLKNSVNTPAAPVMQSKTDKTVVLVASDGYEYSIDGGATWQTSNIFAGLTPNKEYTFVQRVAETETDYASSNSQALKVTTYHSCEVNPSLHVYSNTCDTSCNTCGGIRSITHTYSGACDVKCNVCGDTRTTSTAHTYDNVLDANCNVCGDTRKITYTGWLSSGGKWYFYENGNMAVNKWKADSNGWCYLGSDGAMKTNAWVKDSIGWCYVGANGYIKKNTWVKDNNKWYFVDSNGYMVSNKWMADSNGWCYLGASGAMMTNAWVKDSNGWCYLGADGYCVTNKWVQDSSKKWCYLNANGNMVVSNWVKDGGKWYYVDGNGHMVTNQWMADTKGWCYLGSDGAMKTSTWVKDSNGWCYLGSDGYMKKNTWINYNDNWYFVNANGYRVTNKWMSDSNGWCYLGSDGAMVTNKWMSDSNGWCYLGSDGYTVKNQWIEDSNGKCYVGSNGYMVTNAWAKENDEWVYLGGNGYKCYGWVQDGGYWYYLDEDGHITTGYQDIDEAIYYFFDDGKMLANAEYNGVSADANGKISETQFMNLVYNDYAREKNDYPSTVVRFAKIGIAVNMYGQLCVTSVIWYKIGSYEYDINTLHNIDTNRYITEPADCYKDLADRETNYSNKMEYLLLSMDASKMLIRGLTYGTAISGDYFNQN